MEPTEPLSFWSFIFRSLDTAAADTANFFGWNVKTVVTAVGLLGLGFFLLLKIMGVSETREELSRFVIVSAAPLFLFCSGLFLYNVFRAPYFIYIAEYSRTQQRANDAEAASRAAQGARQNAEERIKALEKELSERPANSQSSGAKDAEITRLRSELDERATNREIREQLGVFLLEGQALLRRAANESQPPPNAEAEAWAARTEKYLTSALGAAYVARFRSSAGLPMTANSIESRAHANLWAGIWVRLARLEQFIHEKGSQ